GSNFNLNYPITKRFTVSGGGNLNYIWIEGVVNGSTYRNDGMQGYMYGYAGYRFEKGWRAGVNYSYNSPWVTLQGKSNAYNYLSFSLNKDIVKDKLSFSASVSNPFQKYRSFVNNLSGTDFIQTDNFQSYYRRFNTSLNYRFGKLKGGIKKNARGIKNDDVKSGSTSGS
ncbi:MAG TPA: outer membrane beta-barrel protein, partial [Sphingobacteriaceae bacterium]